MTNSSAHIASAGAPLSRAKAAMILLHGRGATAGGMLDLADVFAQPDVAYLAPEAPGRTWYPYSFLAPIAQNAPHLFVTTARARATERATAVVAELNTELGAARSEKAAAAADRARFETEADRQRHRAVEAPASIDDALARASAARDSSRRSSRTGRRARAGRS